MSPVANTPSGRNAADRRLSRPSRWKRFLLTLSLASPVYRPERHYMRGPGPKWRERHPISEWAHDPANIA